MKNFPGEQLRNMERVDNGIITHDMSLLAWGMEDKFSLESVRRRKRRRRAKELVVEGGDLCSSLRRLRNENENRIALSAYFGTEGVIISGGCKIVRYKETSGLV